MVRPGSDKTEVSARFLLEGNPAARAWLATNELENDGECIVRRVLSAEGRSRSYINGVPVPSPSSGTWVNCWSTSTVSTLTRCCSNPITSSPCWTATPVIICSSTMCAATTSSGASCKRAQPAKAEQQQREARRQLIEYQVQELDEFALQPGEFEEIEEEHQRLANGTELMQECGYCLDLLYDNEETTIAGLLQTAVDRLRPWSAWTAGWATCSACSTKP